MSTIKKVAIAGASGNLGPAILTALLKSNLFEVTVLTRHGSSHQFPADAKVQMVDYSSEASLVEVLKGHGGVVSTLSHTAVETQKTLIDASIAAGVQRFIPSEFGSDLLNRKVAQIPIFAPKLQVQKYLEEKAAKHPEFSYTRVFPGAFLDWGLATGMLVNLKEKSAVLRDGGDVSFSVSRLATVGQAVVGVFSRPHETANRAVYVKDLNITQNQIISLAKAIDPSGEWKIQHASTEEEEKQAHEGLAQGRLDLDVISKFLFRAVYGDGFGGNIEEDDNQLLGVRGLNTSGLKQVVEAAMA